MRLRFCWGSAVGGDQAAAEQLRKMIYEQLRGMARGIMSKEGPDHTLQPTALRQRSLHPFGG